MEARTKFRLVTKTYHQGVRGETINTCEAYTLTEAIQIFAKTKQLRPDQLVDLYRVHQS